jgi:hypothetical protein
VEPSGRKYWNSKLAEPGPSSSWVNCREVAVVKMPRTALASAECGAPRASRVATGRVGTG